MGTGRLALRERAGRLLPLVFTTPGALRAAVSRGGLLADLLAGLGWALATFATLAGFAAAAGLAAAAFALPAPRFVLGAVFAVGFGLLRATLATVLAAAFFGAAFLLAALRVAGALAFFAAGVALAFPDEPPLRAGRFAAAIWKILVKN